MVGPFPVPSPRDMRERNDDAGQKRRGHRYSAHPSNRTISIDYRDRRSVSYLDHSQHKIIDTGLDQVELNDKIMIDKAGLEAKELLLEIRDRFYKLMLGDER
jgi:hypothetical protein